MKLEKEGGWLMDVIQTAMSVIANAGSSRSYSLEALQSLQVGKYDNAEELMKKAEDTLLAAHRTHSEFLVAESRGEKIEFSVFLLHAESHLNLAEQTKDMVDAFYHLYKKG